MAMGRRLSGITLALATLTVVPFLTARPTVPPPAAPRRPVEPVRLDLDGRPLPDGAISHAGTLHFRHGGEIGPIAFAPDGRTVFTASAANHAAPIPKAARAWSVPDGRELRQFAADAEVYAVAVSQDGKFVATGESVNLIRLWDAATGKELRRMSVIFPQHAPGRDLAPQQVVCSLAFGPDGKSLVADYAAGTSVIVWDVEKGAELRRINPEGGSAVISVSRNGRRLAVASNDGTVTVWDVSDGRLVWTVAAEAAGPIRNGGPPVVALSPDGKLLVGASGEQKIRFCDVEAKKETCTAQIPTFASAAAFAPDKSSVAVVYYDNDHNELLGLFDPTTGKEILRLDRHGRGTQNVAYSPDGKLLATGGGPALRLWDVATGKEQLPAAGHPAPITTITVSSDGKRLATCSDQDRFVRLWDTATGQQVREFEGPRAGVDEVTLSPDGQLLAAAAEQAVFIWELQTGRLVHKLVDHASLGAYLRFSDDGKTLATGSLVNAVALWDCATGRMTHELSGPPNGLAAFFTFNDGRLLAYDKPQAEDESESFINLWDVTNNRLVRRFAGHPGGVNSVILSRDGRMLASRGPDKTIRVWEVATGGERCKFKEPGPTEHTMAWTGTQFLAFSPDNRTLVTAASDDPFARRWNLTTGKEMPPFRGHQAWVGAVEFSANGKVLVTGGQDTTAFVWDGKAATSPRRPDVRLADTQIAQCWDDLRDSDAEKAYRAVLALAAAGDQSTILIRGSLRPAAPADLIAMRGWVESLDDPQFAAREKATSALLRVADQAEDLLRSALERSRSAEAKQRIRRILDAAQDVEPLPDRLRELRSVEVLVHACGQVDMAQHIVFGGDLVAAARAALKAGAPVFCDSEMVAHGVTRARLPAENEVICTLNDPRTAGLSDQSLQPRGRPSIWLKEEVETGALNRMMRNQPPADSTGTIWTTWGSPPQ